MQDGVIYGGVLVGKKVVGQIFPTRLWWLLLFVKIHRHNETSSYSTSSSE
jgi:hypothetical protein